MSGVEKMMYNQMFKKYLIKNQFWITRSRGEGTWFVKHLPEVGGIYARLLDSGKGVEVSYNNQHKIFDNFVDLDDYLDKITSITALNENREFLSILSRKLTSKALRTLPL